MLGDLIHGDRTCLFKALGAATGVAVLAIVAMIVAGRLDGVPIVLTLTLWGAVAFLLADLCVARTKAAAAPALATGKSTATEPEPKAPEAPKASAPEPVKPAPKPEPVPEPVQADIGEKPLTLDAPRDEAPDDLQQIKGIGPKLEELCHRLGFYHFDQIAAWTEAEVAWVDSNLEGFSGRVTRDDWVAQAKRLANDSAPAPTPPAG
ncbi:MAG: NADH:ubiquinone oxidoreductase [Pseudomonadota bacterium]